MSTQNKKLDFPARQVTVGGVSYDVRRENGALVVNEHRFSVVGISVPSRVIVLRGPVNPDLWTVLRDYVRLLPAYAGPEKASARDFGLLFLEEAGDRNVFVNPCDPRDQAFLLRLVVKELKGVPSFALQLLAGDVTAHALWLQPTGHSKTELERFRYRHHLRVDGLGNVDGWYEKLRRPTPELPILPDGAHLTLQQGGASPEILHACVAWLGHFYGGRGRKLNVSRTDDRIPTPCS